MKVYKKGNKVTVKPKMLIYENKTYLNPSDSILIKAGYEIVEKEVSAPEETNNTIKEKREFAYKTRADKYLIAYQAYTELGEHEKASEMRELWILERAKIDQQYPYLEV